jgi:hypothetical protein
MRRLISTLMLLACLVISPMARAEGEDIDGHLLGFKQIERNRASNVVIRTARPGAGLNWMYLFFMIAVCAAAVFKNGRRTHLD